MGITVRKRDVDTLIERVLSSCDVSQSHLQRILETVNWCEEDKLDRDFMRHLIELLLQARHSVWEIQCAATRNRLEDYDYEEEEETVNGTHS